MLKQQTYYYQNEFDWVLTEALCWLKEKYTVFWPKPSAPVRQRPANHKQKALREQKKQEALRKHLQFLSDELNIFILLFMDHQVVFQALVNKQFSQTNLSGQKFIEEARGTPEFFQAMQHERTISNIHGLFRLKRTVASGRALRVMLRDDKKRENTLQAITRYTHASTDAYLSIHHCDRKLYVGLHFLEIVSIVVLVISFSRKIQSLQSFYTYAVFASVILIPLINLYKHCMHEAYLSREERVEPSAVRASSLFQWTSLVEVIILLAVIAWFGMPYCFNAGVYATPGSIVALMCNVRCANSALTQYTRFISAGERMIRTAEKDRVRFILQGADIVLDESEDELPFMEMLRGR